MEKESCNGAMEPSTKVNGNLAELKAKGSLPMQKERSMREDGIRTRLMALAPTFIQTEQSTRELGTKTFNMDMVKNSGQMAQVLKASIVKERKMEWENTVGLMELATKESGKIMK